MKPLTIDSFEPEKIRTISSDQKSVDDFNYTSVHFEYDGEAVPPFRIDGYSKGPIYSLSINCDEVLEKFFVSLKDVIANEICRLIPKVNGKKLNPDSFELVKSSKHGTKLKPRPNELNISLNFAQQMFSDVACCSVMFSRVGGQTG